MAISQNHQRAASPRQAGAREREEQALALRRAGASYRDIGAQLGASPGTAHKWVKRAIERQIARVSELAEEVQQLELDRLDRLMLGIWPAATAGNVAAIDRVLKIMERRARILGLDAPAKVAATDAAGDLLPAGGMAVLAIPAKMSIEEWQDLVTKHAQLH